MAREETFGERVNRKLRESRGTTSGERVPPENSRAVNEWARRELRKTYRLPPDREEDRDDREEQ